MNLLKDKIETLYQKFLWPSLFAAMVTTIYSFVDTIAIGQGVGPDGAAAAAIIYPILGVASLFGFLCGIGGSVRLGNARGEGQLEKANAYYTAALTGRGDNSHRLAGHCGIQKGDFFSIRCK